jgi:hypothetical protein
MAAVARLVVGAAVSAALVTTAPASAQEPTLPLEVRGVRVQSTGPGAVQVTFTREAARLYRRVAGRPRLVRCQQVDDGTGPLLLREDRGSELVQTTTAPARRRPISLRRRGSSTRYDVCRLVAGRLRGGRNPRFVTSLSLNVPASQAGAVFLHERSLGDRMVAALDLAAGLGSNERYPLFPAVSSVIPNLVELASPDATPAPPGALGFYSDGAQHVTVVAVTLLGRRLFIDANGEVLTSNVPQVVADLGD